MEEGKRRQLIVCCDGTNNNLTGRTRDTNVSQLCELLAPDANNQLLYYDPGVPGVWQRHLREHCRGLSVSHAQLAR
jgi:uncharacterized protein (DUF2235 family)